MRDAGFGRSLLSVLGAGLAFALGGGDVAEAQEAPRYELHVGYAFLRDQDIEINFPVGWSSSFAFNLTDSVGVVADVGGNYKSEEGGSLDVHAFLGGARYSFRGDRVTPYVEGLFGVARAHASGGGLSESASDLAAQAGVGVGFKVSDRICVRAGFDFRNVFTEGESAQEFRVQAGLSFGFGGSREEVAVYAPPAYTPPRPQAPPTVSAPTAPPAPAAPPPQAPPTLPPAAAPAAGPFGRARELLSAGSYSEAAAAFRADLPAHAASMFTIPVGVYCDVSNLAQQVQSADAQDLLLVRLALRGQLCYGLYWGLFSSGSEAQAALAQLPPALRSPGQAPISVSRVLSRAR